MLLILFFFFCRLINTAIFFLLCSLAADDDYSSGSILHVFKGTHANYGRKNSRTIAAAATVTSSFTPITTDIQPSLSVHIESFCPYPIPLTPLKRSISRFIFDEFT